MYCKAEHNSIAYKCSSVFFRLYAVHTHNTEPYESKASEWEHFLMEKYLWLFDWIDSFHLTHRKHDLFTDFMKTGEWNYKLYFQRSISKLCVRRFLVVHLLHLVLGAHLKMAMTMVPDYYRLKINFDLNNFKMGLELSTIKFQACLRIVDGTICPPWLMLLPAYNE